MYYKGIAPSFEALYQEFVIDPISLRPEDRERRKTAILSYFRSVYDKASKGSNNNRALRLAYEQTRKWAYAAYVTHHVRKAEKRQEQLKIQPELFQTEGVA